MEQVTYAGLDVHKNSIMAVFGPVKSKPEKLKVGNNPKGWSRLGEQLKAWEVQAVFEASSCGFEVHDLLHAASWSLNAAPYNPDMATLHIYAGSLDRLEAMLYARRSKDAGYGPPDKLLGHLLNENVLERVPAGTDPEAADAALRRFVDGPAPEESLDRTHALVLNAVVDVLCVKIGDEAFGATTLAALSEFGARFKATLGDAIAESLSN